MLSSYSVFKFKSHHFRASLWICLVSGLFFISQCGKSDLTTVEIMPKSQWEVTNYSYRDSMLTSRYQGWIFKFTTNNQLTVTKNADKITGNWLVNTSKDGSKNMELIFSQSPLFDPLNNSWKIKYQSESKLTLEISDSIVGQSLILESL